MKLLIDLINLYPALSILSIILLATIIVWRLCATMSSVFVRKGEAEIVRALIIARGRDGATLEDIKSELGFKGASGLVND